MEFIKAFIVGIAASVPVGPIAILVIQKTLCKGFKPGFITGLGATVVDTLYAIIALFALTFVMDFIEGNPIPIFIGGGFIVMILGLSMTFSNPFRKVNSKAGGHLAKADVTVTDFLAACAMGLSNPGAIAVMFALMAFFGINEHGHKDWAIFPVILGIASGSIIYWLAITATLSKFCDKINIRTLVWINRIAGGLVIILGMATLAEGIMRTLP